jgi:N-methylhydantoinase A
MKLSDFNPDAIIALLGDLEREATGFVRTCSADAEILSEFKVYMRYTGQGWEIPISLTQAQAMAPDAATFKARFIEDYTKLFGRSVDGMDVEITVWSVNATTPPEHVDRTPELAAGAAAPVVGQRRLFDPAAAEFQDAAVVLRDAMIAGASVSGPAAITEDETTIIIPTSRMASRQPDGCIDVRIKP